MAFVQVLQGIGQVAQTVGRATVSAARATGNAVVQITKKAVPVIKQAAQSVGTVAGQAIQKARPVIQQAGKAIVQGTKGFGKTIANVASDGRKAITQVISDEVQEMREINQVANQVGQIRDSKAYKAFNFLTNGKHPMAHLNNLPENFSNNNNDNNSNSYMKTSMNFMQEFPKAIKSLNYLQQAQPQQINSMSYKQERQKYNNPIQNNIQQNRYPITELLNFIAEQIYNGYVHNFSTGVTQAGVMIGESITQNYYSLTVADESILDDFCTPEEVLVSSELIQTVGGMLAVFETEESEAYIMLIYTPQMGVVILGRVTTESESAIYILLNLLKKSKFTRFSKIQLYPYEQIEELYQNMIYCGAIR